MFAIAYSAFYKSRSVTISDVSYEAPYYATSSGDDDEGEEFAIEPSPVKTKTWDGPSDVAGVVSSIVLDLIKNRNSSKSTVDGFIAGKCALAGETTEESIGALRAKVNTRFVCILGTLEARGKVSILPKATPIHWTMMRALSSLIEFTSYDTH